MSVTALVALVYNWVPSDSPPVATAVAVGWWWWCSLAALLLLRDSELEPSAIRTLLTAITKLQEGWG